MPITFNDVILREVPGTVLLDNIHLIFKKLSGNIEFSPMSVITEQSGLVSLTVNDAIAIIKKTREMSENDEKLESVIDVQLDELVCFYLTEKNIKDNPLFLVRNDVEICGCISAQEIFNYFTPSFLPQIKNLSLSTDFVLSKFSDSMYSVHTQLYREKKKAALIQNDQGSICGVITDYLLRQLVETGCDIWNTRADKYLRPIVSLPENMWLKDAYSLAVSEVSEIVVVLNTSREIKGIVSREAIARSLGFEENNSNVLCNLKNNDTLFLDTALNESLLTGIVGTDENLRIVYFNEAMSRFLDDTKFLRLGNKFIDIIKLFNVSEEDLMKAIAEMDIEEQQPINSWCTVYGNKKNLEIRISRLYMGNGFGGLVFTVQDKTEQYNVENVVRRMAYFDMLTGLPNRSMFKERLDLEMKRIKRFNGRMAMMMCDLNDFKEANDRYGHAIGDKLLIRVGELLSSCIRETDIVARYGGDEFLFLLPDMATVEDVNMFTDRVQECLSVDIDVDGVLFHLSAALGYTFYPDGGTSFEELLRSADLSMYRDKKNYKSSRAIHTDLSG